MEEFSVSSFPPVLVRCFGTCPEGNPPLFSMMVLPAPLTVEIWGVVNETVSQYSTSTTNTIETISKWTASGREAYANRLKQNVDKIHLRQTCQSG